MNSRNEIEPYVGMKVRFNNNEIRGLRKCYEDAHGKVFVIYKTDHNCFYVKMDGNSNDAWFKDAISAGTWIPVPGVDPLTDPEYEGLFI